MRGQNVWSVMSCVRARKDALSQQQHPMIAALQTSERINDNNSHLHQQHHEQETEVSAGETKGCWKTLRLTIACECALPFCLILWTLHLFLAQAVSVLHQQVIHKDNFHCGVLF